MKERRLLKEIAKNTGLKDAYISPSYTEPLQVYALQLVQSVASPITNTITVPVNEIWTVKGIFAYDTALSAEATTQTIILTIGTRQSTVLNFIAPIIPVDYPFSIQFAPCDSQAFVLINGWDRATVSIPELRLTEGQTVTLTWYHAAGGGTHSLYLGIYYLKETRDTGVKP